MSYGLEISNPSGGLVLSTDGFGMNYIGKATYSGTVSASNFFDPVDGADSLFSGSSNYVTYRQYQITSAQPVAMFFDINANYPAAILQVTKSGSVYTITAMCNDFAGGTDADGFYAQVNLNIYCFARPTANSGTFGLALYDAAGTLSYDLSGSSGAPLFFKEKLAFSATDAAKSFSGTYTKMAAFGGVADQQNPAVSTRVSGSIYYLLGLVGCISAGASTVNRNYYRCKRGIYDISPYLTSNAVFQPRRRAANIWLIEAGGL